MSTSVIRILVIDDFQPFRRFVVSTLQLKPEWQVVGEASDGLEAVRKAQDLRPDLIVLDIGLPRLNGMEVARRVRRLSPNSKIICLSQETSADIVSEALLVGVSGYVAKADAMRDLIPAIEAVLRGEHFVNHRFAGRDFREASEIGNSGDDGPGGTPKKNAPINTPKRVSGCSHEAGFYSDDRSLLNDVTPLIADALNAGNAAIVFATESHQASILSRLQTQVVDFVAASGEGRYIELNAADIISAAIVNGVFDEIRVFKVLSDLIVRAERTVKGKNARVAIFGESGDILCAQGYSAAAIQLENVGNQLAEIYDVDILCGYSLCKAQAMDSHIYQGICEEHSAVRVV